MHGMRLAVFGAILGAAMSIPQSHTQRKANALSRQFDAPTPPGPVPATGCKAHIAQADCSSDKCCNWCGPNITTVVPIGWCMPLLPVATSLVCDKVPTSCAVNLVNDTCVGQDGCKWIPTSPVDPAGAGICMYDWDACKTPPATPAPTLGKAQKQTDRKQAATNRVAKKHAKAIKGPSPTPPVPKLNCTLATAEECDASKCCQWCGSAWNATAPGWCMPVLDEPMPMMTCSKGSQSCSSLPAAVCNVSDTCSWMPFGPPTSPMGVCIFDWKKCAAPTV